jgi:hypothetical protein
MFEIIHSFDSIDITNKNTLVICDIDDTVIHFQKNAYYFYDKLKDTFMNDFNNNDLINITTIIYDKHKIINRPKHTDLNGFYNLTRKLEELSGNFIFLTARNNKSDEVTKQDLLSIYINPYEFPIHYTNNSITKGEYINKHIDLDGVSDIIFIDDLDENLISFNSFFPNSKYYKFIYDDKNI